MNVFGDSRQKLEDREMLVDRAAVEEAAELIIARFPFSWAYKCLFRFSLAVYQRALMREIPLQAPSLELGINDGSSATIAHFGKGKFTFGGDMPEESTFESMGLYIEPDFDVYEHVVGLDAHELPFPDRSFNTVITNDMLSYGLDREKIVREMLRVLAPGGTLFFTETGGSFSKYPELAAELRTVVPTINVVGDTVSFYRTLLGELGAVDVQAREYFDDRLAAVTYATLLRGELKNEIDDAKRGFYEEGLRALASILADDLVDAKSEGGWQVAVQCMKPGPLNRSLDSPEPICLSCRSTLDVDLDACVCRHCGLQYLCRFGNPYILSDYGKAYSPKKAGTTVDTHTVERLIDRLAEVLKGDQTVNVFGYDHTTKYMIRRLQARGKHVELIYAENRRFIGHDVLGIQIVGEERLAAGRGEVVVSPFVGTAAMARLYESGFAGTIHTLSSSRDSWRTIRM